MLPPPLRIPNNATNPLWDGTQPGTNGGGTLPASAVCQRAAYQRSQERWASAHATSRQSWAARSVPCPARVARRK